MAKKGARKEDDTKLFAFLAVFLTVIGFIIALVAKKDNKYVMHYGKQGLVLFIAWVIVSIASAILAFIPVIGPLISWVAWLCMLALWIIGLIYSLSGEMKNIPLIGQYADMIRI